jgi:predicted 3-demethylubiquinone-9 3-methyltransferase (glyoxalase superfamily)
MKKVTPFLTFQENGEEAIRLYVSLIKNSKINHITRSEADGLIPKGALQSASFELDGQEFLAMDGGTYFNFAQGFSLMVACETQAEIDRLWEALSASGQESQCGWLNDRYGMTWQIIPQNLGAMLQDPDADKSRRVLEAMLQMKKLDIQALETAYAG